MLLAYTLQSCENLFIFSHLTQGKTGPEADQEVTTMIEDLQLVDKTNVQSTKLSGGMKRKLRYDKTRGRFH